MENAVLREQLNVLKRSVTHASVASALLTGPSSRGRPPISTKLIHLIKRLSRENATWEARSFDDMDPALGSGDCFDPSSAASIEDRRQVGL